MIGIGVPIEGKGHSEPQTGGPRCGPPPSGGTGSGSSRGTARTAPRQVRGAAPCKHGARSSRYGGGPTAGGAMGPEGRTGIDGDRARGFDARWRGLARASARRRAPAGGSPRKEAEVRGEPDVPIPPRAGGRGKSGARTDHELGAHGKDRAVRLPKDPSGAEWGRRAPTGFITPTEPTQPVAKSAWTPVRAQPRF